MDLLKKNPILTGVLTAILVMILAELMFNPSNLVSIIIGAGIGILAAATLVARSRGERTADVVEEVVQQVVNPTPDALKNKVENLLMELNESLRVKSQVPSVTTAAEEVIDLLLEVVPRALDDSPNSEATFDLEKLSTDYLSELLNNFMELSNDDQAAHTEDILNQLQELAESVRAAKKSLDEGNLDDFQISSSFLRAKTA